MSPRPATSTPEQEPGVRLYGPNEIGHPFAVTEMIVRNSRGEIVKVLREKRGEWVEESRP